MLHPRNKLLHSIIMLSCFSEDPFLSSFLIKIECALVLLSPLWNTSRIQVPFSGNYENVKKERYNSAVLLSWMNPQGLGDSQHTSQAYD